MTDDLVARLHEAHQTSQQRVVGSDIFAEAADRIETAEAEITVKEQAIAEAARLAHKLMTRALAAEARVRELEAELDGTLAGIDMIDDKPEPPATKEAGER